MVSNGSRNCSTKSQQVIMNIYMCQKRAKKEQIKSETIGMNK
jgi:hypothetical protein